MGRILCKHTHAVHMHERVMMTEGMKEQGRGETEPE